MPPNSRQFRSDYLGNPNLPTEHAEFEYTEEQIKEIAKCSKDVQYFADNYFYIVTADEGKQKISLFKTQKRVLNASQKYRYLVVLQPRQTGKCLDLNTPILTENGWKTMGTLELKDKIYSDEGKLCNITHIWETYKDKKCYELIFSNGEKIVADEDHNWFTQTSYERNSNKPGKKRTTKELLKRITINKKHPQPLHRIKKCPYLDFPEQKLDIDPYLLGLWLGDGSSYCSDLTVGKQDREEFENQLKQRNITYNIKSVFRDNFGKIHSEYYNFHIDNIAKYITSYNIRANKHIPEIYLKSSHEQRLELLRGLMDTDGSTTMMMNTFYNTNKIIIDNVVDLLKGLGCINYKVSCRKNYCNGKQVKDVYRITFKLNDWCFNLPRKRLKQSIVNSDKTNYIYIRDIKEVPSRPVRCITVDAPNSMFLCGKGLIPTSNTTIMSIYALHQALFNSDKSILIVANKEDTAKMILRRIRMAYEQLPNWLKAGVKKWGETEVIFANDSMIGISTTTTTTGVGQTVNVLIIDEAARIQAHLIDAFWESVIPVISSGKTTKIFMISTACGTQGKFYEIYSKCEKGELPDWHHERVDWWEIPGRTEKWKRQQISALGSERMFNQEFGNQFLDDGEVAIDAETIEEFRAKARDPTIVVDDGNYRVWETPIDKHVYVIGVDVAEGVGRANSVAIILDITDLTSIKMCAIYADNKIDPSFFANKLVEIAVQWGNPYLLIERNNSGGQVIDALRNNHQYENLVTHLPQGQQSDGVRLGIYSHTSLKYKAVTNMRYWVNTLKVVDIPDIMLIKELETFVKQSNNTWKKKQGDIYQDDRVMSLVWALFALEIEVTEKYFEIEQLDDQGKPLKINHLYPDQFRVTPGRLLNSQDPLPIFLNGIERDRIKIQGGNSGYEPYSELDEENRDLALNDYMGAGWKLVGR